MSSYKAMTEAQARRNRAQEGDWVLFAAHRRRLQSVVGAEPKGGRICLLGAGNGNDLDLPVLSERFSEVHLVDLDPEALKRNVARQSEEVRARLRCHAPVDLAGDLLERVDEWKAKAPSSLSLKERVRPAANRVVEALPTGFDVVVSTCVLSQMFLAAARAAGGKSALAEHLCSAIAAAHVQSMTRLLAPGGRAVLVCDMSSSAIAPGLTLWEEQDDASELIRELAQAQLHSIGTNPFLLRRRFREDAELGWHSEDPRLGPAWVWRVSEEDLFAVFSLSWRRQLRAAADDAGR